MGGICREIESTALIINGVADHVHLLIEYAPKLSISELVRVLKANSSKWVHETFPSAKSFAWQTGYAAFSVSRSNLPAVKQYIANQEEHHRRRTFQEELVEFLNRHEIAFDPRYAWT